MKIFGTCNYISLWTHWTRTLCFALVILVVMVIGGHEILYKVKLQPHDIQPEQLLIAQFDTRPLGDYWNVSVRWNKAYCDKHNHQYMFLTSTNDCVFNEHKLADPWCKVKAMAVLNEMPLPGVRAVLFVDSDAVITVNYSMTTVLAYIQRDLNWSLTERPVAFNQDGPGWACKNAIGVGYDVCLNSGTVIWRKGDPVATAVLGRWWESAGEPYGYRSRFTSRWRTKWPWEQAQQYEVYRAFRDRIQLLSFPSLPFLPWTSAANPKSQYPTDVVEPWCLSHWPGANCFVSHHCASRSQKAKMRRVYDLPRTQLDVHIVNIDGQ